MDWIWQKSPTTHPQLENVIKVLNFEIQDDRRPLFWKTLKINSSKTVCPIVTKFKLGLRLSTLEKTLGSRMKFCKIQDGRRAPIEIYKYVNNVETVGPK